MVEDGSSPQFPDRLPRAGVVSIAAASTCSCGLEASNAGFGSAELEARDTGPVFSTLEASCGPVAKVVSDVELPLLPNLVASSP